MRGRGHVRVVQEPLRGLRRRELRMLIDDAETLRAKLEAMGFEITRDPNPPFHAKVTRVRHVGADSPLGRALLELALAPDRGHRCPACAC